MELRHTTPAQFVEAVAAVFAIAAKDTIVAFDGSMPPGW
jgi:hypothetical protein